MRNLHYRGRLGRTGGSRKLANEQSPMSNDETHGTMIIDELTSPSPSSDSPDRRRWWAGTPIVAISTHPVKLAPILRLKRAVSLPVDSPLVIAIHR